MDANGRPMSVWLQKQWRDLISYWPSQSRLSHYTCFSLARLVVQENRMPKMRFSGESQGEMSWMERKMDREIPSQMSSMASIWWQISRVIKPPGWFFSPQCSDDLPNYKLPWRQFGDFPVSSQPRLIYTAGKCPNKSTLIAVNHCYAPVLCQVLLTIINHY